MVNLVYTHSARNDLKSIFLYISNDSPLNAKRFIFILKERIKTLKNTPEKGRPLFPEKFPTIRQVLFRSYRIVYVFKNNEVAIIAISHQSRLLSNIEELKPYII